jgi:hypothetical protein
VTGASFVINSAAMSGANAARNATQGIQPATYADAGSPLAASIQVAGSVGVVIAVVVIAIVTDAIAERLRR